MNAPPVQYVTTSDGYRIAYRVVGKGHPWVIVPAGFSHLELTPPELQPWIDGISARFTLVRYDGRGSGLSTRDLSRGYAMADSIRDLEAVLEQLRLEPVVLHASGAHSWTAIRFAARHPEQVRAMILASSGRKPTPSAMAMLASTDWETFLSMMARGGRTHEETESSKARLRQMVTQDDFLTVLRAHQESTIDDELDFVRVPTLVLHPQHLDSPSLEDSADLVTRMPNARLADVPSHSPLTMAEFNSAWPTIESFLEDIPGPQATKSTQLSSFGLSPRELEVLRLLAAGRSNQQIAVEWVISLNTVNRHVSNIYAKTGAANRAQAVAYAKDRGLA